MIKQPGLFEMPYFNGLKPRTFLKETREFYTKKAVGFGVKMSFNKDFDKSKNKI